MSLTTYIRYRWHHDLTNEPVELWSELDENRYELRKLEFFRNGKVGYADKTENSPDTQLADQAFPDSEDIQTDDDFELLKVSKEMFERHWEKRRERHL